MYETSATWSITNADGTAISFNTDADLRLEAVTGFDSPNVRQNIADLPETDGAIAGDFFFGSRPVTFSGKVISSSAAQRNTVVAQMQRALRALRSDLTIRTQSQGLPAMRAYARLDNFRVTGGFVKDFSIGLVCADPRFYSEVLNTVTLTAAGPVSGAAFPWVFPVSFGGGTGGIASGSVPNAGNIDTAPVLRITGPVANPYVVNTTTGASLYLDGVGLAAGEYVDIDVANRTVTSNGGLNWYARVRFPASTWLTLAPGANFLQLWASSSSAGVSLIATYRDAWA
jgi:hypothetical protein